MKINRNTRIFAALGAGLAALTLLVAIVLAALQIDIPGPSGSGEFGKNVTVLPNGNLVVADPIYDAGSIQDIGAVYLYDGSTGALISTLTGAQSGDQVGSAGVKALANGNYLVLSPYWKNGVAAEAGAVTWASGVTGASGAVSAANSLVGSSAGDHVGGIVTVLADDNYVVISPSWDNGTAVDAGAVTWASGVTGASGAVSATNSLVGSATGDRVGDSGSGSTSISGMWELSNGNYLVRSPNWHNGQQAEAGALTWVPGNTFISGVVSAANSLVGSATGDRVGDDVMELPSGNYLAVSPKWDNGPATDAGAVTWGSGTSGVSGVVSSANSLVGSSAGDYIGKGYVVALANGNYVVHNPNWDNGPASDAGAVTWGSGTSGVSGVVGPANSLVGSTTDDRAGDIIMELANGNYVVVSYNWDNGAAADAGAVTWGSGTNGVSGEVNALNSLVGTTAGDQVGYTPYYSYLPMGGPGFHELASGNYVINSPYWSNGSASYAGSVTWGSGNSGVSGKVNAVNSLVGNSYGDEVGAYVTGLPNGNYVVRSPAWDNGPAYDAGAVTWGSGTSGASGAVSALNSLVGSTTGDQVGTLGDGRLVWLANSNYVVASPYWDNGPASDAGAVTWGSGTSGVSGVVGPANSLVGGSTGDHVGGTSLSVTTLANGNYVVRSLDWDNGAESDAGAVTWGSGTSGVSGVISSDNSLVGSSTGDQVGIGDVTVLANNNIVVISPLWDNGTVADAGAVTWAPGNSGIRGEVSTLNSLVGSSAGDNIGGGYVAALANGNYVVHNPNWDNGTVVDAGAVTWGSGTVGVRGAVSAANSLVSLSSGDQVGSEFAKELVNGNFVVMSPLWDNGTAADAGAITWGSGVTGVSGVVSPANSLVGSTTGDQVGSFLGWVYSLSNGNYLVGSPGWDDGPGADAGAITWGSGISGVSGEISALNSLVGSSLSDQVGLQYLEELERCNVAAPNPKWDNGPAADAGAVTWISGATGVSGPVSAENSVLGLAPGGGNDFDSIFDELNWQLVVGHPADQTVTIFRPEKTSLAPVANAGPDQSVQGLTQVTLDARVSMDPDCDYPLTYQWTQSAGLPVSISGDTTQNPTLTAPESINQTVPLTFTLVVTDSSGQASQPDQVVITVGTYQIYMPVSVK